MSHRPCPLQVVLETEASNAPALALYESLGFVRDKRLAMYYLNGGDAFRCVRVCVCVFVCVFVHAWTGIYVCACVSLFSYIRARVSRVFLPARPCIFVWCLEAVAATGARRTG